jgi:acyl-CoA synthetase (AMP-forming)/AMP-acid ligase II
MKNTVDFLRKDLKIYCTNDLFDAGQIDHRSKIIKNQIYNFFSGNTTKKNIYIYTNDLTIALPAIIAIWELGASVVVHDYNPGWESHPKFKDFYSYIDLVLLPSSVVKNNITLPNLLLDLKSNDTLDLVVDVELDWPAAITHTSGTTRIPVPIQISHRNAIGLVKKNIEVFDFNSNDRFLHYKTLHHGSLFLNYAIPAMSVSDQHFFITNNTRWSTEEFLDNALKVCQNNNITFWLIPYNWIRRIPNLLTESYDLSKLKLITVMGPTTDEIQKIFDKTNVKEIFNNFGCTEVGSLFLSKTNKNNIGDYNPNKFYIINNEVDLEFHSNYFKVKHKSCSEWNVIGDMFEIDSNNSYWWRGRCNIVNNENKYLQITEISKFLEEYFSNLDFSLVPDFELNKIYLAVFSKEININTTDVQADLNKKLFEITQLTNTINKVSYFTDDFIIGMKPSQPLLLYSFRLNYENS